MTIWDALSRTDPAHTKTFKRAGGFSGTALKPQWMVKRLTEQFGPVGIGWGHNRPTYDLVHTQDGEVLVYCTVECWHTNRENTFHGVGGDKVVAKRQSGSFADDEAFKKAFTDAVGNAFKFVGIGADIHLGQFDDSKYVAQMEREYAPTIDDKQREELMALLDANNIPAGDFLKVGNINDLRDVPADKFASAKAWVEQKAKEKTGE